MKLLNHARVKRTALEFSKITGRPFTRVSSKFIEDLEVAVCAMIRGRVHSAPGRKTL